MLREAHLLFVPGVCDEWRDPAPGVSANILVVKRPGVVPSQPFARFQHTKPDIGPQLPEAISCERGCKAAAREDDVEIALVHALTLPTN